MHHYLILVGSIRADLIVQIVLKQASEPITIESRGRRSR